VYACGLPKSAGKAGLPTYIVDEYWILLRFKTVFLTIKVCENWRNLEQFCLYRLLFSAMFS